MNIEKNAGKIVYRTFESENPEMSKYVIDWWPSGKYEITIRFDNGTKIIYDAYTRGFRYIKKRDPSEEVSKDEYQKIVGRNIRREIDKTSKTAADIAELAGINKVQLSRYINGTSAPSNYVIMKIAEAIGCSISSLLTE